jgi:putative transposase
MIGSIQQGLRADGYEVSISRLCRWFGVSRRTVYYRSRKSAPRVREDLLRPIKTLIEQERSFDNRTVAHLLCMNKNTVQRIFQLERLAGATPAVGHRPRIEVLP